MSEVSEFVREAVRRLAPYRCARDETLEGVLLDANENPYPRVYDGVALNRYPDPLQRRLRQELANYVGLGPEWILAGSGSDEVLDWIFKTFELSGGIVVVEPTYGMYRVLADLYEVPVVQLQLGVEYRFCAELLRDVPPGPRLLFLCSPNNPTGTLLDPGEIRRTLEKWEGLVVLDEAYIEFSGAPSLAEWVEEYPRLLVLRTLSKAFGRAGMRLGYVVAQPELVDYFTKVKAPYNLNAWVQEEGVRALRDRSRLAAEVRAIVEERERMAARLAAISGVQQVFPSRANFLLFRCSRAREVWESLFREGIVVRDRSSVPGLDGCIRVSVGRPEENELFLDRLRHHLERLAT
ncbi:MAG: histidinol-phosphate transaminase [Acidobacteriota bacterium]